MKEKYLHILLLMNKNINVCAKERAMWKASRLFFFYLCEYKLGKLFIIFSQSHDNYDNIKRKALYTSLCDQCFLYIVTSNSFQTHVVVVALLLLRN